MKVNFNDAGANVKTYEEAIRFAGNVLIEEERIKPEYIDACIEREVDFPTGLLLLSEKGVAMPHGNSDFVHKDSISVVRTANPVAFGRMEDNSQKVDCNLVFNLALASGDQHLTILRKLIGLFQDDQFITDCLTLKAEDAAALVQEKLA